MRRLRHVSLPLRLVPLLLLLALAAGCSARPTPPAAEPPAPPAAQLPAAQPPAPPPVATTPCTAPAPAAREGYTIIWLAYHCGNPAIDFPPVAVPRQIPTAQATPERALAELLKGPTPAEQAVGFSSWFSQATEGKLRSLTVGEKGYTIVDFADLRPIIPNASTSAGGKMLMEQLGHTLARFPQITKIEYRINGDCSLFYEWLQSACEPVDASRYR